MMHNPFICIGWNIGRHVNIYGKAVRHNPTFNYGKFAIIKGSPKGYCPKNRQSFGKSLGLCKYNSNYLPYLKNLGYLCST